MTELQLKSVISKINFEITLIVCQKTALNCFNIELFVLNFVSYWTCQISILLLS